MTTGAGDTEGREEKERYVIDIKSGRKEGVWEGGGEQATRNSPASGASEAAAAEEGGQGQPDHHHVQVPGLAWGERNGKENKEGGGVSETRRRTEANN